ncbi:MAG: M67 family metallopeptidase [Nitrospirae bacterium]|nr:M67 family metallopeptidase [Nitrospirota bacterium]MBI3594124.1 M67 family metallopeptidase [Nitrospirota bacterium]
MNSLARSDYDSVHPVATVLKIPKAIQEALYLHAQREKPIECCGLLAGIGNLVTHHYQIKNSDQSPTTYFMDPREQFWAFGNMRQNQLELLAIYHSHTHTPAYPSATDIRLAYYPESYYLIVTLMHAQPQMRLFKIPQNVVTEESFEIV